MTKPKNYKKRVLNHLGKVGLAIISASLVVSQSMAIDPVEAANQAVGSEGGREAAKRAINGALVMAKSKSAMTTATAWPAVRRAPGSSAPRPT